MQARKLALALNQWINRPWRQFQVGEFFLAQGIEFSVLLELSRHLSWRRVVSGIDQIEVECLPQDLPEVIEVDISTLNEIGSAIYMKDIPLLPDVDFLTDPEELIAVASAVKEEVVEEVEEDELLDVDGEGVEPEVLEHGKKDEDTEPEE